MRRAMKEFAELDLRRKSVCLRKWKEEGLDPVCLLREGAATGAGIMDFPGYPYQSTTSIASSTKYARTRVFHCIITTALR